LIIVDFKIAPPDEIGFRTAVNGIKSLQEVAQHEQTRMVVDHLPKNTISTNT
jgi:hypothetical protein